MCNGKTLDICLIHRTSKTPPHLCPILLGIPTTTSKRGGATEKQRNNDKCTPSKPTMDGNTSARMERKTAYENLPSTEFREQNKRHATKTHDPPYTIALFCPFLRRFQYQQVLPSFKEASFSFLLIRVASFGSVLSSIF